MFKLIYNMIFKENQKSKSKDISDLQIDRSAQSGGRIDYLINDYKVDELILKSDLILKQNSNCNAGDISDICKNAIELAYFENHINNTKRAKAEEIYKVCYKILFDGESIKNETISKLKEYFDGYISAINRFGIGSILWSITEENISGDDSFKFAVQKRFESVFPQYYDIITKNKDQNFIDNANKHFIQSIIQENHGVSPNSFNVLFYLVLSSNKTLYSILGNDSDSFKSFIYNYQESYNKILSKSYGTELLTRNALLSISMQDSIGNIATAITWFQNNKKSFTKECAVGVFLYTVKGYETAKSIAIKSCQNIRPSEIEDLNHLLHFIAVWVAKNLSKQYFEEHFEHIMALDLFKTELNQFIESFDSTYQKWIETSNKNLNLGACILFKHFAGISEKSNLVNSKDDNDFAYILEISKSVDNMIVGVIDHFFYLAHSSINNDPK